MMLLWSKNKDIKSEKNPTPPQKKKTPKNNNETFVAPEASRVQSEQISLAARLNTICNCATRAEKRLSGRKTQLG